MTQEKGKRRRWPWIALGIALVLFLAAALAIPALLKPERFRARIETALESATGWDAELGEIDFSIARGMMLTVSPGKLSAPGDSSSVAIETLAIKADLLPLFRGQLEVQRIDLLGPDIRLVREDEATGWVVPLLQGGDETAGEDASGSPGLAVSVQRLAAEKGRVVIDDRVAPGFHLELQDVDLDLDVATLDISVRAAFGDDGGQVSWSGPVDEAIALKLEGLRTELLHPWLGKDLLHAGGRLSGTVTVDWPESIRGDLTGTSITLLAGERPFENATTTFEVVPADGGLRLESFEFAAEGARLTGSGPISPALALVLIMPETSLQVTLRAAESVLPLPLDVKPPGSVRARFRVDMPAGGDLTYTASGALAAAEFRAGETLPVAADIQAEFDLDRRGLLEVRILRGTVAGGAVSGTAWVDPVYPPGELRFDGGLQQAALGNLLDGYVKNAGREIGGPTAVKGKLTLNLGGELNARALGGQIDFDASDVSLPGWDLERAILGKIEEKLGALSNLAALLDEKLARRLNDKPAESEAGLATELLESMSARVDFDAWPWRLERLTLGAGDLSASGEGTFDPDQGRVDLNFTSRLSPEVTAALVGKNPQLKPLIGPGGQLVLPLRIEGPMLSPTIGVDLEQVALEALGAGSAKDAVKDALKGFLDKNLSKKKREDKEDNPDD